MEINFNELLVGMVLEEPLYRNDNTLILQKGTILTERMIHRLKNLKNSGFFDGVIEVNAEQAQKLLYDRKETPETISSELRNSTATTLEEFFENPDSSNIQDLKKRSSEIASVVESCDSFKYDLENYQNNTELYAHSVRVACFSAILAKAYNTRIKSLFPSTYSDNIINLQDITTAALLQDLGKTCKNSKTFDTITRIPGIVSLQTSFPGILDTPLDKYDEKYFSVYSYCMVASMNQLNTISKFMILLSNEPDSENGCLKVPFKLSKSRSPSMYGAKIIHLCDIYDNAMQNAIAKNSSLEEVVSELEFDAQNSIVNSVVEQLFINTIPIYPVDTRVKLSTGEYAIVKENFKNRYDSYKPVVRTVPFPGRIIDLRNKKTTTITIDSVVSKDLIKKQIDTIKFNVGKKPSTDFDR